MDIEMDSKTELIQVLDELFGAQLITTTGGNMSVRDVRTPERAWIMPSGIHKGRLTPEQLVLIDLEGSELEQGKGYRASSEKLVHCEIFRARADVQAVVHAHALHSSILCMSGLPFLPISTGAAIVGDIPVVPFIMPGTRELGQAVAAAMGKSGAAVFMQNHGLVVVGTSLRRAADLTFVIERTAAEILGCHAVGIAPPVLNEEALVTIRNWRTEHL